MDDILPSKFLQFKPSNDIFFFLDNNMLLCICIHGSRADDVLQHFKDCTKELHVNELIQISMDGPNMN